MIVNYFIYKYVICKFATETFNFALLNFTDIPDCPESGKCSILMKFRMRNNVSVNSANLKNSVSDRNSQKWITTFPIT